MGGADELRRGWVGSGDVRAQRRRPAVHAQLGHRRGAHMHTTARQPTWTPRSAMVRQASASASVPISSTITIWGMWFCRGAQRRVMLGAGSSRAGQQAGQAVHALPASHGHRSCPHNQRGSTTCADSPQRPQSGGEEGRRLQAGGRQRRGQVPAQLLLANSWTSATHLGLPTNALAGTLASTCMQLVAASVPALPR